MRKIFAVLVASIAFSLLATAQDYNKADVFGGFQYTSFDTFNIQRSNMMGWDAQVTDYISKPLGITADVSGSYGSPNVGGFTTPLHNYSFLFGPTFRAPLHKATPFVHALFGFGHISHSGGSYSSSAFAYELGGGLDIAVAKSFSYRVVQADYYLTRFSDPTNSGNGRQDHFRFATGVVFKF